MNEANTKKLCGDFSELFGESFYFECDDGWFNLIYNLCSELAPEVKKENWEKDRQVTQVKEKWGGLRFYLIAPTDKMYDLIEKAENESFCICEICGDLGGIVVRHGWLKTYCEEHASEQGFEKPKGTSFRE